LRLDVGCGLNKDTPESVPQGDVNCDLQKPLAKISNFVLCDAQHLPFKDKTFSFVYSSHVIEHVDNPFLMLKELIRVANSKVLIRTPHRLLLKGYCRVKFGNKSPAQHRCHFDKKWFVKALRSLGIVQDFKVEYSDFKCLPHYFVPLIKVPAELKVEIRLGKKLEIGTREHLTVKTCKWTFGLAPRGQQL